MSLQKSNGRSKRSITKADIVTEDNRTMPHPVAKILREHFMDLGADRTLPANRDDRMAYYSRFYISLVIDNLSFPTSLPVSFVLIRFLRYCVHNRDQLKGFSISNHIALFKKWLDIDSLREGYYRLYQDQAPKQLSQQNKRSDEEREKNLGPALEMLAKKFDISTDELKEKWGIK